MGEVLDRTPRLGVGTTRWVPGRRSVIRKEKETQRKQTEVSQAHGLRELAVSRGRSCPVKLCMLDGLSDDDTVGHAYLDTEGPGFPTLVRQSRIEGN